MRFLLMIPFVILATVIRRTETAAVPTASNAELESLAEHDAGAATTAMEPLVDTLSLPKSSDFSQMLK